MLPSNIARIRLHTAANDIVIKQQGVEGQILPRERTDDRILSNK